MSRLTQRDGDSYTYSEYATSRDGSCCFGVARLRNEAIDKLGRLEDKEDRLGCPLETVLNALSDGVYVNIPDITNGIEFFKDLRLGRVISGRWRLIVLREGKGNNFPLYLDCLGKTWALAKEELQ